MRRFIGAALIALLAAACTPEQVGKVLGKPASEVTPQEMAVANAWEKMHNAPTPADDFLRAAYALNQQPFLKCTRAHESDTAGGYLAYNGSGPYYGAYQFLQSTWDNTARHAGWIFLIGVDARRAGGFWQDMMAWHLYQWQGKGPWGGRC